jgi:nucleotide-binding universal stress UspA family protein
MKILIAVDGSESALHAAKYAADLASQLVGRSNSITLISVHDDAALRHAKAVVGHEAVADYLRERSEGDLASAKSTLDALDIKYGVEMRTGHVAQEIVDCARQGGFDLIVLGAKGRGAVADLLLGSVAQRVLAKAEMPVVLVK